jgi:hypothetical protein
MPVIDTTRKLKLALIKQGVPKIEDFYQTMYMDNTKVQKKFIDASTAVGLVDTGHSEVIVRIESGAEFYDIWVRPCGPNKAAVIGQLVHAVKPKATTNPSAQPQPMLSKDGVIWEMEPLNTVVPAMINVRLNTLFSLVGVTLSRATPADLWQQDEEPLIVPFSVSESRYSFYAHKTNVVGIMPVTLVVMLLHPKISPMIRQSQLLPSMNAWAKTVLGIPQPYCQDGYRGMLATADQILYLLKGLAKPAMGTKRQAVILSDLIRSTGTGPKQVTATAHNMLLSSSLAVSMLQPDTVPLVTVK